MELHRECNSNCDETRSKLIQGLDMNEHDRRVLIRMINFINEYKETEGDLRSLVNKLEGSLSALEDDLPASFTNRWFSHLLELDTVVALGEDKFQYQDTEEDIEILEELISTLVSN